MMAPSSLTLSVRQRFITLPTPAVMGVINCSAGSFFHALPVLSDAVEKAQEMIAQGALIIDVGAVATNPKIDMQSDIPSPEEECDRVLPVIEAIAKRFDVLISVDTSSPVVMQAAVSAGAGMINDQRALRGAGALEMAAKLAVPICLMHHFNPIRLPESSSKTALLSQILNELQSDVARCLDAGIAKNRLIIDPGFGGGNFGKSADENFFLLSQLYRFKALDLPILVGLSRKAMLGELLNLPVENRLNASVTAAVIAAMQGADIVRVHDVKETVEAMHIVRKIKDKLESNPFSSPDYRPSY